MDLLKVLRITDVSVVGDTAYAQYVAPAWIAGAIDEVVNENSPTGQFLRGMVLGMAAQDVHADIGSITTIYLQPENWEMPSMTLFLSDEADSFEYQNHQPYQQPYTGAYASAAHFATQSAAYAAAERTERLKRQQERLDLMRQGREMVYNDLEGYRALFAKVSTVAV